MENSDMHQEDKDTAELLECVRNAQDVSEEWLNESEANVLAPDEQCITALDYALLYGLKPVIDDGRGEMEEILARDPSWDQPEPCEQTRGIRR